MKKVSLLSFIVFLFLWSCDKQELAVQPTEPVTTEVLPDSTDSTDSIAPIDSVSLKVLTQTNVAGFSTASTGVANTKALQVAVDKGGIIYITKPGTYNMAGTVYIGSNTSLIFSAGVYLKKVNEKGVFTHVILNKGALTKTYNEHILIEGLSIIVNGQDRCYNEVCGLRGQLAFFYVKDLKIERFRCEDLCAGQFGIHVCTFEDLVINNVVIKGNKDGIHLGRGNRFKISNATFQVLDDAIALNGHDYGSSNPELGWIENGVIENCTDQNDSKAPTGYFSRILAGAWIDWKSGMEVKNSDAVVSNGRIYRVQAQTDGKVYKSYSKPSHTSGNVVLDGITWAMVQTYVTYTAGVRNVTFKNITLEKPRIPFSIHFDNNNYSRSYYPGATIPLQQNLVFDGVKVMYDKAIDFIAVRTPVDNLTIKNSTLNTGGLTIYGGNGLSNFLKTNITISTTTFKKAGDMVLINNNIGGKEINLKTTNNIIVSSAFKAKIYYNNGKFTVDSDLPGLKK